MRACLELRPRTESDVNEGTSQPDEHVSRGAKLTRDSIGTKSMSSVGSWQATIPSVMVRENVDVHPPSPVHSQINFVPPHIF